MQMATARSQGRWIAERVGSHVVPVGTLLLLLGLVHEVLLAPARPASPGETAYLQLVVIAQSVFLAATLGASMAIAPRLARPLSALVFTLPALLYVDTLVALRIDRHLPAVMGLLFAARVADNRRMLEATGIDLQVLVLLLAGLGAAGAAGVWLDARSTRRGASWSFAHVPRWAVLLSWMIAGALLGGLEAGAAHTVSAATWTRFGRSVPLVLGVLGPTTHAKASVHAALRPLPSEAAVSDALARLEVPTTPAPGDVFFFVVESLRADAIDPATTPAMAALAREGIPIGTAVSGGDVTQYGWFSLFRSRPALYWGMDSEGDAGGGAVPLRIAKRRGWRVEVLTSSDLRYMHIDADVLGTSRALADDFFDASAAPGSPATRDVQVMRQLAIRAARPHAPTVFIVSLDATHLPYLWTDDFDPPLLPYAGPNHYLHVQADAADRQAVVHRYRDSVAFIDSLLARFVGGLRAAGAGDDATLVVAGDHGEEFWEHGLTAHASEACAAQTHVALIVSLSRAMREAAPLPAVKLASGIDVWPTLLDAAGVRGDTSALFGGRSLLRGAPVAAIAVDQAYWHRPGRFAVDDGTDRAVLELSDPDHPFRMQELLVLDRLDEADAPTQPAATASEYVAALRRTFGADLERSFVTRW
jgi:membrane-anchored protein YejM (alkaline phosphatase superfamily)